MLDQARRHRFFATLLHPGHIVGPGWEPVNPTGRRPYSDGISFRRARFMDLRAALGSRTVQPTACVVGGDRKQWIFSRVDRNVP